MQEGFPRPFGRYTLLANLAQGGMGALYLGCTGERGMEKLCVIKTVLPHLADKEYVARFRDEAKVVVKLSHGNLVPVFDAGLAGADGGDELYLAMEHVDGKDLRAVWNRCAKKGIAFPVDVAVYIARELARGLHHAHRFGAIKLVHRDVSPPNVLVSYFGEVKLTDFGLAASTMKTEKTAPGVIYGKVSYMSPEQARGEPLDGRTDLYSVAIILWELLTGKQCFPQSDPKVIEKVRSPEVQAPSVYASRVPLALDAIVVKALAPDRKDRYADCEAFRAALAEFLALTTPTTDNARVAVFLAQLFGGEIESERTFRQALLDRLAVGDSPKGSRGEPQKNRPPRADGTGADDLIGTYLDGRYLVKRLIGEGGMGLVYEAEHVEIGRRVAIKILHAAYTRQAEVVARFRSEARAATRIGHPHIIDVFDSGTTVDGAVYFVMEFLEGRDLADVLDKDGLIAPRRAVSITREICEALAAAHEAGIVHRDMKPENVYLIEKDGRSDFVKVLDFGIAKTLDSATGRVGRLTNPGVAMGTPEYMAPEQAAGSVTDARVDVYALGAILYEMLTGRPPHEGGNIMEVLTRKATETPIALGSLRPDVPRDLERLVMRTLAISPEYRPQSMAALREELGKLRDLGAAAPAQKLSVGRTQKLWARRPPFAVGAVLFGGVVLSGLAVERFAITPRSASLTPAVPSALPASANAAPANAVPASANVGPAPANAVATSTNTVPTSANAAPLSPLKATPSSSSTATGTVTGMLTPSTAASPTATKARLGASGRAAPVNREAVAAAERLIAEARTAVRAGDYDSAEHLFGRARSTKLVEGPALAGLAEIAFQRGHYLEAIQLSRQAGGGVDARLVLGNSYFKLERYDEAIAAYREVLRIDHGHAEARSNLMLAQKRKGD